MRKIIAAVLVTVITGMVLTSCSGKPNSNQTPSQGKSQVTQGFTNLSGSLTLDGSSALQPLAQAAADNLKKDNPNLSITVNAGGSGKGLTDVYNKTVDIGNSDVEASEKLSSDKATQLVDHKVCIIGIATVVNPDVKVDSLTKDQLIGIFTGKIKNWKEVGGNDEAIVIINRPTTSGTRTLYKKIALDGQNEAVGSALQQDDSGVLEQTVAQTKGAIGYLALSYTKGKTDIKLLKYNGVDPTYDNIYQGKYPIWGYEHMYTSGQPTGIVKSFLDYMTSKEFGTSITEKGYGEASKIKS
ncbi:MAG TPA: phosphate ABC transporter substrate-binding protein [Ruminiclostridium sp.]|nr:phosphate ABC transporter substrate-binding protein [Ruminiclostridium sp.]